MRYVKKYESFKQEDSTNEEFLGALYNAAKGALKNFLGNISAPFKTLKDDFKKGMEKEQVKKTMITKMDALLKAATDGINKAEDVTAVSAMREDFIKEIDSQIAEFDKEVKIVKESNSINEGKVQDALIGARVAFGMVKKKAAEIKADFDEKFKAAKDLAGSKKVAIDEITNIINEFKKNITNDEIFKKAEAEYRAANNIATLPVAGVGTLTLDWGDVELVIKLPVEGGTTRYEITSSNSKKLNLQGKSLFCDIEGVATIGAKVTLNNITLQGVNTPYSVPTYETGALTKMLLDGKEVDKYEFKAEGSEEVDKDKLTTDLKALQPDQMKRVVKFVDFINTKADKLPEIDKLLGGEEAAVPATEE